jgi:hypothetical protein
LTEHKEAAGAQETGKVRQEYLLARTSSISP